MYKYGYLFANIITNCKLNHILKTLQSRRMVPASAFYKITIKDNIAYYSK